jgi:hypothetical protein
MTPEQQAAYVMAMAACAMAKIAGMQAENQHKVAAGRTDFYTEDAFDLIANEFGIHHNAVIAMFTGR